jgi:catechol 2,3-dioxygenase-like lactoylglutathione lyase family enzyme
MTFPTQPVPPWQGIHHLALVTPDFAATPHSYQDVLGLRLVLVWPVTRACSLGDKLTRLRPLSVQPVDALIDVTAGVSLYGLAQHTSVDSRLARGVLSGGLYG